MKIVKLIHNPSAGDQQHSPADLVSLIESKGYKCMYSSIKEDGWKEFDEDIDIIAVAGGDGAVRKVCKELVKRKLTDKRVPIAILPAGTANNIATSLGLGTDHETLVSGWQDCCLKGVDIGTIKGHKAEAFFIEAIGFGIFPNLINHMKKLDDDSLTAEESLRTALEELVQITETYQARECNLVVDGVDHSGKFLLVEVMNMPYLGPNLDLNSAADPGDGELEIVIVPEDQRSKLVSYVKEKAKGDTSVRSFSTLKGRNISMRWRGLHAHVDDSIIKEKNSFDLTINVNKGVLDVLLPNE